MNSETKSKGLLRTGEINNFGHFNRRTSKNDLLRAINALQMQNQVQVGVIQKICLKLTIAMSSLYTYEKTNLLFREEAGLIDEKVMKGIVNFVETGKLQKIFDETLKVIQEQKGAKIDKSNN